MSQIDVFIVAGEPSGDLHGAKLIEEMLLKNPKIKIAAVAGPLMRKLPILPLFRMEDLSVMGFIDVFLALPKIIRLFFSIRKKILSLNPKAVIFIDYPGFNLRLERSLRKQGFSGKLIHYICPTVWAWGKKRIPMMAKNLDLLLTFFPFEKGCFSHTKLRVEHVGHPLVSGIKKNKNQKSNILALFPGSRSSEIERNLPLQINTAKKLQKEDPSIHVVISIAAKEKEDLIKQLTSNFSCTFSDPEKTYELMETATLALATSGTVTLELALHNTPAIVNYAIRPFDLFLAQKVFKINLPFYCIVNIIAGKEVFPEFFGPNLTEKNMIKAAQNLWFSEKAQTLCQTECERVREMLSERNASFEASSLILSSLQ